MIAFDYIQLILYFLNPFSYFNQGLLALIDILTFFVLPYIFLRRVYNTVWWRVILFYCGFIISQITYQVNPISEYIFEVGGILLILYACIGRMEDRKESLRPSEEQK